MAGSNLFNRPTGDSIDRSQVVEGYEYEEGRSVVLSVGQTFLPAVVFLRDLHPPSAIAE